MFKIGDKVKVINFSPCLKDDLFEIVEIIKDQVYDKRIFGQLYLIKYKKDDNKLMMFENFLIYNEVYYRKDKLKKIKEKING